MCKIVIKFPFVWYPNYTIIKGKMGLTLLYLVIWSEILVFSNGMYLLIVLNCLCFLCFYYE